MWLDCGYCWPPGWLHPPGVGLLANHRAHDHLRRMLSIINNQLRLASLPFLYSTACQRDVCHDGWCGVGRIQLYCKGLPTMGASISCSQPPVDAIGNPEQPNSPLFFLFFFYAMGIIINNTKFKTSCLFFGRFSWKWQTRWCF